eukprot:COSAG02_NODE_4794_length_4972_cov_2.105069_2_plen_335_part_00
METSPPPPPRSQLPSSHNVQYIHVPGGGATPTATGVGQPDAIAAEAELRSTLENGAMVISSTTHVVEASDEMAAVQDCTPHSAALIDRSEMLDALVQEGEPPLSAVGVVPATLLDPEPKPELEPEPQLEPEPELELVVQWPELQDLEGTPSDDDATQGSQISPGKGSPSYREAWIASEALMLAFHDDLVSTQNAHARSERQLEELRTTSVQQIESLTAKSDEEAAHVARLEADAKARESQLSLVQAQLVELQAEREHEQGAAAEKQHQLATDLKAEQTTVALQGDVIAALRRVVSLEILYTKPAQFLTTGCYLYADTVGGRVRNDHLSADGRIC